MTMLPDFLHPQYLHDGSPRQHRAYLALQQLQIFDVLVGYSPILVGTIPLGIDVPSSDLDVLLCSSDLSGLGEELREHYGRCPGFEQVTRRYQEQLSSITRFQEVGFAWELFAQATPVTDQQAYLHMVVEARILAYLGEDFKADIIRLKRGGLKTEPAFAKALEISGDPYATLAEWYYLSDQDLFAKLP